MLFCAAAGATSQTPTTDPDSRGSIAISPARFELEMKPGTETTVVLNLDYRAQSASLQPVRIVASLSDWTIARDGRVEYFSANTRPNSASSWIIYSPGESSVVPGNIHQIRATVAVPKDAEPGDYLAALTVEQRPDSLKNQMTGSRTMVVRYRMASVFYIKVPGTTKRGSVEDLYAAADSDGVTVAPTLKNLGNTMLRPVSSVTILDEQGRPVANAGEIEPFPVLAGAELRRELRIAERLPPGKYTVKYRVDFLDGRLPTEGITDFIVPQDGVKIASLNGVPAKP